ncbi:hypothetical protein [Terasakiella pusilla]|uniref:hypothetical protein n=1 Tax=Terasakiella pusilla TaxID=64973 RepID=UPI003AA8AC0D
MVLRLGILIACFCAAVAAQAKDVVTWHVSHFPPVNIMSGPFENEGFADKTRSFFQRNLMEYSHQDVTQGYAQSMESAQAGTAFCRADMLKTPEREKVFYFSQPVYFTSGRRLLVSNDIFLQTRGFANKNGDVRFSDLLGQPWAKYSYVKGRVYFPTEQEALKVYRDKHPELASENSYEAFNLLKREEANMMILYPFEYGYYLRLDDLAPSHRSLQLAEMEPFSYAYFACSKTPKGKRVIEAVNSIVKKEEDIYSWLYYYKEWVSHEEWQRIKRFFYKVTTNYNEN